VKINPDDPDDTLGRMAFARRMAAMTIGVDELPPDAEVEMSIDDEGNCQIVGKVLVSGYVPSIECKVKFA
jgi:hypothetical protein